MLKLKKKIALLTIFLSILLILISIESITGVGVVNGQCTFYQTISPLGKYFSLTNSDTIPFSWLFQILFTLGLILLYVPNFIFFKSSRLKSMILIVINTLVLMLIFLFYKSSQYMLMMIAINILITINIILQHITNYQDRISLLVFIVTMFIGCINIYYLYYRIKMVTMYEMWYLNGAYEKMTEEMTKISQTNIICFIMWFIPLGILTIQELIFNHKEEQNIIKS